MNQATLPEQIPDFDRNGRGQPVIHPVDGGRPVAYNRPSSWGKKLEDTYNLEQWTKRMIVVGMSRTPALTAQALTVTGGPSEWSNQTKDELNRIATDALTAAKASQAADIGTALHRMTEMADLGHDLGHLPEPYATDVAAYTAGMAAHNLVTRPEWVECRMVCDQLKLAGTTDRIIAGDGQPVILDLKTGATVTYAALGYAVQLAIYAHSDLYNVVTGQRTPVNLNQRVAYIAHLPAGTGQFTLYEVDIEAGWEAALECATIDRWRKHRGLLTPRTLTVTSSPVATPGPTPVVDTSGWLQGEPEQQPTYPLTTDVVGGEPSARSSMDRAPDYGLEGLEFESPRAHPTPLTPAEQRAELATNPDEGGPADPAAVTALERRYRALTDTGMIKRLTREAMQFDVSFHLKGHATVRRFEILRALINLVEAEADDEVLRAIAAAVIGPPARHPNVTSGHIVGSLNAEQAATFARYANRYATDITPPPVSFTDDGVMHLDFNDLTAPAV